jgi:hypothetical protein
VNRSHVTATEAEDLYRRWYDSVAGQVREAAATARGRRSRHRSDLEDLHRHLGSVDLRQLLEPEPEALPGTPAQAVADADRFLAEAEQHHAWGVHKAAIVWLQQAYAAANLAIEPADTAASPGAYGDLIDGPIPPRPDARIDIETDLTDLDGPGTGLPIPRQRS